MCPLYNWMIEIDTTCPKYTLTVMGEKKYIGLLITYRSMNCAACFRGDSLLPYYISLQGQLSFLNVQGPLYKATMSPMATDTFIW